MTFARRAKVCFLEGITSAVQTASACSVANHGSIKLALLLCLVFLVLSGCVTLDARSLQEFMSMFQSDPLGALPIFFAMYVVAVVLLFPGMVLQLLAGALYGFSVGLIVAWAATSLGQALAFLLGRYLFRDAVASYLSKKVPNFPVVEAALVRDGWKLVSLLRISPVLPYNVLNYALAVTAVGFWTFSIASSITIIPYTCLYVYLGSVSTDMYDVLNGNVKVNSSFQLTWTIFTITVILAGGVWLVVRAKRTISEMLDASPQDQSAAVATAV